MKGHRVGTGGGKFSMIAHSQQSNSTEWKQSRHRYRQFT